MIDYISIILNFYSSSQISLESLFICLSIDALIVRIVSLGRVNWVSKLRAIPKIKTCKIDRIIWEMKVYALPVVAEFTRGYPLPIHYAKVSVSFGDMNGQFLQLKTSYNTHFPYRLIRFASFRFGLHPKFTQPACAQVKQP